MSMLVARSSDCPLFSILLLILIRPHHQIVNWRFVHDVFRRMRDVLNRAQVACLCAYNANSVQEKKAKHKQQKSKKKKKAKDKDEGHNHPDPRLSDSPRLSDGKPESDTADPQPDISTSAPQEAHTAEWDTLINRVSDQPRQQATGNQEPASKKEPVSQAPRLDDKPTADRSGRVGDGGSGWRRRLQMRQAGQHLSLIHI